MYTPTPELARQKLKSFLEGIIWIGTYKIVDINLGKNFTVAFSEDIDAERFQTIMEAAGATTELYSCH